MIQFILFVVPMTLLQIYSRMSILLLWIALDWITFLRLLLVPFAGETYVTFLAKEGLEVVSGDNLFRVVVDLKIGVWMFFWWHWRTQGNFRCNRNNGKVITPGKLPALQLRWRCFLIQWMRLHRCYFIWIYYMKWTISERHFNVNKSYWDTSNLWTSAKKTVK